MFEQLELFSPEFGQQQPAMQQSVSQMQAQRGSRDLDLVRDDPLSIARPFAPPAGWCGYEETDGWEYDV